MLLMGAILGFCVAIGNRNLVWSVIFVLGKSTWGPANAGVIFLWAIVCGLRGANRVLRGRRACMTGKQGKGRWEWAVIFFSFS